MAIQVRILPPSALYLSNPQDTDLGRRILARSVPLMNSLGLEDFTFKKLAAEIGSAEASIYRYFSNKNQLLLYLTSWYWDWVHHLVVQKTIVLRDPWLKLKTAIGVMTHPYSSQEGVSYIDQRALHQLVIYEGTKAYRTKLVDQKNSKGLFVGYKGLTEEICRLILWVDPGFKHPNALASSIFEMAHDHLLFAKHLPRLTDLKHDEHTEDKLEEMLWNWTTKLLARPARKINNRATSPRQVFVTRNLKADSPLRHWASVSGNFVTGRSLLKFQEVPFVAVDDADWWFFYSSKAAEFCLFSVSPPANVRLAAQGEGTAKTIRELTGRVDFVGQGAPAQVCEQFRMVAADQRVFFPRAKNSCRTVQDILADDIIVLDAVCYDNLPNPPANPISADLIIFTSPLNVAAYVNHYQIPETTQILAIGGTTAAALYQYGYAASFPAVPSEAGLVELLTASLPFNSLRPTG